MAWSYSVIEHAKEEPTFYSEIAELLGISFEQCVAGEVTRQVEELMKELDFIGDDKASDEIVGTVALHRIGAGLVARTDSAPKLAETGLLAGSSTGW